MTGVQTCALPISDTHVCPETDIIDPATDNQVRGSKTHTDVSDSAMDVYIGSPNYETNVCDLPADTYNTFPVRCLRSNPRKVPLLFFNM